MNEGRIILQWPEIFTTGSIKAADSQESLVADGLTGWANCILGAQIPKKFGEGMDAIGHKLGITATPENLEKMHHVIMKKDES